MSDLIEGVKRRHKSARPKIANPAWCHTHDDLGIALDEIERLEAALRRSCQCGEGMCSITGEQCAACAALAGDDNNGGRK